MDSVKKQKEKFKKIIIFLPIVLLFSLLTSCSNQLTSPDEQPPHISQPQETILPSPETVKTPHENQLDSTSTLREITDMAGRTMNVPDIIETVFSANPISAIYIYTIAPEKLLGWNYELNAVERSVILEKYQNLPNFGMGDSINYEAVIAAVPTIAINVTTINDGGADQSEQLAKSLGIPVVTISDELEKAPEIYRFLGQLLGAEEQGEKLAAYAEKTFADIAGLSVSEEDRVRIYYGNGENSLETAPAGSSHGQIIDMVNAINVADIKLGDGSRAQISLEQLLAWNPDVIIVNGEAKINMNGGSAAAGIMDNPDFSTIKAVQNNMVFGIPNAPFSWIDRPRGPNRIIGMRWLSVLIYPEYINYNVDEEVSEFFRLFYHVELTDEKLEEIYHGIT